MKTRSAARPVQWPGACHNLLSHSLGYRGRPASKMNRTEHMVGKGTYLGHLGISAPFERARYSGGQTALKSECVYVY